MMTSWVYRLLGLLAPSNQRTSQLRANVIPANVLLLIAPRFAGSYVAPEGRLATHARMYRGNPVDVIYHVSINHVPVKKVKGPC